jgi:hypothetical protein
MIPSAKRTVTPAFAHSALRVAAAVAAGAVVLVAPEAFAAASGTPIDQAATNAVDMAQGLGVAACAGGVIATCAGGMLRSGGIMAGGATTAVCGGAWAGAPDVVQQMLGGAGGAGLADLATLQPATADLLAMLSSLVGRLIG